MAIVTATCWAFTSIFFTYSGRRVGSPVVNISRLLFALIILSLTHLWLYGNLLPFQTEPFRWGWLAFSGILGLVVGDSFLFQAFVMIGPRLSSLMMALVPIFSTFLSWLFLGETVDGQELTGIVLAIGGVAWVVTEKRSTRAVVEHKRYGLGILFGLGGAVGQASGLITAKFGLIDDFPAFSATLIRIFIATFILGSFTMWRGNFGFVIHQWQDRKALWAIVAGTIIGPVVGVWLSLAAIQIARVGIASTLMSLTPIILIPLSYFIYQEQISLRSIVGPIITFSGVALIFL